ncbi:MAG TPA: T9SS type A sorting domain-containing protein, partial [Ignavibacteria bacterium]|nr:T9SS type A sorting domain-containing protein [Ignavibacteria bacterium]
VPTPATVNTPNNLTFTGTLTNTWLNLVFTGANAQTVTLPGNRTINNFTVTKSADKAITVSGGNLTLAPAVGVSPAGLLTLTRGIVNMVNPALLTLQATVLGGIITNLGYLRNPANILNVAHVVGRLGVFIPAGTIGRSEWPVGALNGDYRPAAITFTAGNATIAPTTIIVSHIDSEPTGVKNFPLNGGTQASDPSKTNWIGTKAPYSWLIEATTSLGASQVFDLELQGTNLQKPLQNHNDLRIIRRFDGNVSVNGWVIEGNNATYSNAMSINVPAPGDTMLTVRDRGSLGSAIAQKAFFTIGAPATLPVFNLPTTLAYTVPEKDSLFIPVKTLSNSVNTTITKIELMSGPSFVTYANATGKVDSGTVTIKPTGTDASTTPYTAVLKTTDSQGATSTITLSITVTDVNAAPVFTKTMGSGNIKTGDAVDSTYTATDADGDALTFSITATTGAPVNAATIDASTGAFSWQSATADAGKTFTFAIAVTDGKVTVNAPVASITVVANRPPTWAAGGEMATPQTIFVGDTLKQNYKADDLDNDAITYAFVGNHPSDANLNAATGVFTWAPQTASQFPVIIQVSATDGKSTPITTQAIITIKIGVITVAGKVTYDNTSNTPIVGATVKLMNGSTVAGTAITDATGDYSITGVTGGTSYTLTATKTTGWPSNAVLASDALLAARYSVSAVTLTANQKLAADVTGDGNVTAGDALQILRRVVGAISSFTISDWQFETKTVAVAGASVTANFKGIAAGDVNESATTLPKKSKVSVINGKNIKISPNSEFKLPVTLNAAQKVGAFTLRFTYPVQMMTFKSVKSNVDVISYAKNGKISVAWAKMPGEKSLKDGETPSIILVFKATKAFAKSTSAGLTLTNGEIVNAIGKNMADASVNMSQAEVAIPSVFALSQNYPNPFNPSTIIEYQLPVKGNVTLTIYNTLGQVVKTLINNQVVEAGSYKTRWNATNLASGIYFYSLRVEGAKSFLKTKKMILLK